MKRLLLTITILLWAATAQAANHFIRSGASGSNNGSDWTNAYTSISSITFVRGDVYYVASGSYTGSTFSTPASGTSLITIKGATVSDHGTNTGWSNSYSVSTVDGGSQAVFTSLLRFNTSYWVWDGSVGNPWDENGANYGFSFTPGMTELIWFGPDGLPGSCGTAISNITLNHFYAITTTADVQKEAMRGGSYGGVISNVYIGNFLLNYWQGLIRTTSGGCSGTPYSNWTIEYGTMLNGFSSSGAGTNNNHGEWIDPDERAMDSVIIRYCYFKGHTYPGTTGSGSTGVIVGNNQSFTNSQIYGNVFNNMLSGNGIITDTTPAGAGDIRNILVYNNVFANSYIADCAVIQANNSSSTGNVAYNNIFYNISSGCTNPTYNISGNWTHDYNWFGGSTGTNETHKQSGGASNPFVNPTTTTSIAGFKLSGATNTGITLPSPYNIDPLGNIRGADGVWDIGAYEFVTGGSGGTVRPMPPILH